MTVDIPNVLLKTPVGTTKHVADHTVMKIKRPMLDKLVELDAHIYRSHVAFENSTKIWHMQVLKAIDWTLQSTLLLNRIL